MATITGLTADRMIEMENATIIDGSIVGDNLILTTKGGTDIDTGNVRGPIGPAGGAFIICTSTTRPTLTAGEEGKAIYETDTDLVRIWLGTRWRVQERIICTSTTRPAGLGAADEGVKIYETDTNTEFVWTGSSWIFTSSVPPGSLVPTILTNAPTDYTLCYGQTITGAATDYPVLWGLVDPAWKSGSNLVVPDLRGRFPIGKDNMGGTLANRITAAVCGINGSVMGASGGDQRLHSHNHSATDSGHGHGVNDPGHSHGTGETVFGAGLLGFVGGSEGVLTVTTNNVSNISLQTSWAQIVVANNGAGSAQNVPPSVILNWLLKLR